MGGYVSSPDTTPPPLPRPLPLPPCFSFVQSCFLVFCFHQLNKQCKDLPVDPCKKKKQLRIVWFQQTAKQAVFICVFKYARTVKQKVDWSETGESSRLTPVFRVGYRCEARACVREKKKRLFCSLISMTGSFLMSSYNNVLWLSPTQ